MPAWWTVNEGPFIAILGAVLLWLAYQIKEGPELTAKP
jgi:hypothetical protein